MAQHTQEAQQQPQTKSAIVVAEDKAERKKDHLRVLVTNATNPMAHTIATAVAQGYVFGYDQPIILHLLDAKGTMGMLEGLVLELLDCTYPLLRQVLMTTVDDSAFTGIDAAFLLYEAQDAPVNQGVQLFRRYGAALEKYAKRSVKVVVCGCQVAINAFACIQSAPSVDSRNITALTRLEHNQNFGYPVLGVLRYRDASGSESIHCTYVSTRFKRPPYGKENDTFREAVFHYANQSCDLGLEKPSAKHVVLLLPVDESPCPFETSFWQAVSAHAHSVLVARNLSVKSHKVYFAPGSNGTVPPQDIILGEMFFDTAEKLKSKSALEWSSVAANESARMAPAAKLYLVHVDITASWIVLGILACSTVAVGALWAGNTKKMLFLTLHRRVKPKSEPLHNDDADLDVVPVALAAGSSYTSLALASTSSVAVSEHKRKHQHHHEQQQQQPFDVRSRPRHGHKRKPADDFASSDEELLNEDSYFGECPVDGNLITLFVLAIAVNLLLLYYFFSKMWPVLVGCIAIGAVMSLIIIFDCIAFLIPCASARMTNLMFPCFVRSMELRHHIVIWFAVAIPIVWIIFRKAEHAWILQDFLGSSFAINILRCVHFPNFKKDVSVMESVAMGVQDLPVLMRVPHFFPGESAACNGSAMFLGYGDIAVPGYAAGLIMALTASSLMDTGQPALLYLVPAILLPVILLAWCRGDLKNFWNGDFVPKEGLMTARTDVCVSSSEQFQMIQGRGLLYVSTPVFPWLALPMPVSQKAYNAK
ncbi:uncharacterized protein [Dermacentor andersoni]|uniref:uncharacterized protein isoform X2 n=1 Tax=Dermacentor andersoni TaxID=34620 RepID=UPI0024163280|nr:uncharacterized protein LOC126532087 isoform X2 [Dermacentor andersoni]